MWLSLRRWRPVHLFAAWSSYWVGLAAVSLGPAIIAGVRATQTGGSITGGLSDSNLGITVIEQAGQKLEMSAPAGVVSAWVVVPPLILWALWLWQRRADARPAGVVTPEALPPGLHQPESRAQRDWTEPRTPVPDER